MYISSAVHQAYEPRVIDEYVLRGNAAIVKCLIPSFVSDYVQVVEWVTDENESLAAFSASNSEDNYGNGDRSSTPIVPIRSAGSPRLVIVNYFINRYILVFQP